MNAVLNPAMTFSWEVCAAICGRLVTLRCRRVSGITICRGGPSVLAEPVSGLGIGVPATGAFAGGGVRISCLWGVKTGAVVLLPLLAGVFAFLVLAWALGAILSVFGE